MRTFSKLQKRLKLRRQREPEILQNRFGSEPVARTPSPFFASIDLKNFKSSVLQVFILKVLTDTFFVSVLQRELVEAEVLGSQRNGESICTERFDVKERRRRSSRREKRIIKRLLCCQEHMLLLLTTANVLSHEQVEN